MPGQHSQSGAADGAGREGHAGSAADTRNTPQPVNVRGSREAGAGQQPANGTRRPWVNADRVALLIVALAALSIRGVYIYQQQSSPDFDTPMVDAEYLDDWARAFAEGRTYTEEAYYRAPLYAWTVGVAYKLFGTGPMAWRVVQAAFGTVTCGLVFLIGRLAFSRIVGLIAGLATATFWTLVYYTGELLIPSLGTLLNVLLVLVLLVAYRRERVLLWGLAGFVLGLSAIARPNILFFAPAVIGWIAVIRWRNWRPLLVTAAIFAAGCLLSVLPVTLRNYVVGGDWVLISSQGGANLYIGNNPDADGYNVMLPGTRSQWHDIDQVAIAERAEGRELKPSEVSDYYLRQTWEFVTTQPGKALALLYRKLTLFWNAYEFANNQDLNEYTARYTPIVRYLPLTFGVIAPLGLLGVVVSWPRRRALFPLWGFVLVYMVGVVLFFVTARFRIPVVPVLILYATVAVDWIVRTIARRRWRPLIEGSLLLGLLLLFSNGKQEWKSMPGSWEMREAALFAREGRLDQAAAKYEAAIARNPGNFEAHGKLALLHLIGGDIAKAEQHARQAIALNRDYAQGHDALGAALGKQGQVDEALLHFQRSVELVPQDATAQQHLGGALALRGRLAEADGHLRQALALEPGRADTLGLLGFVAARQGNMETALEHFRESVSINPTRPDVYIEWARALQSHGRPVEAVAILRQGFEQVPGHYPLAVLLAGMLVSTHSQDIQDPEEAVFLAEMLCERDNRADPRTLHLLAEAYALAGRCEEAVREARGAIPLAEQAGLTIPVQQLQALMRRCAAIEPPDIREDPGPP